MDNQRNYMGLSSTLIDRKINYVCRPKSSLAGAGYIMVAPLEAVQLVEEW